MKRSLVPAIAFLILLAGPARAADSWVGTWATSPQRVEPGNLPPAPGLAGATLRQVVRVSLGGRTIRATFSNAFGEGPLTLISAHLAVSTGASAIDPKTDRAFTFDGAASVTIPAGALVVSDPVDFDLAPLATVALTLHFGAVPRGITGHPGSRSTSYLLAGDAVSAPDLPHAARTDHWYVIDGLDVVAPGPAAAIVALGDSITDGHGSTTNGNDRWPDQLARLLQANPQTAEIGVLNQGIGGNRLLRDGLGPNALARFDRDVIAQAGVRWLIVLEGVNDLGTAVGARAHGFPGATAADLIAALRQIVIRAHTHGIRVYGGTITPFGGFRMYDTPASEAAREQVNRWIRTSGVFDRVIDFDQITRDPKNPQMLSPRAGSADHLHPGPAGYAMMAAAADRALFGP